MKKEKPRIVVELQLTDDQQRQLFEQTGISMGGLLIETEVRSIRIRFSGLTLHVPGGVFVPTAATEHTLSIAADAASRWRAPIVVDVGTGCGAVALAIAHSRRTSRVYGTDISETAIQAARRNRRRLSLGNVRFLRGSLLSPLPQHLADRVNVIVANAPYVPRRLRNDVADVFPEGTAIGGGRDGLDLIREIARDARRFLVDGGCLVLQLADFQWPTFSRELTALGYSKPRLSPTGSGPVAGRLVWRR